MAFIFGSDLAYICSSRAAVVPYTIIRTPSTVGTGGTTSSRKNEYEIKFLVGVDRDTGEITDLGGGVKHKLDFNNLNASIRELTEETKEIFSNTITAESLLTCVATTQSLPKRFPIINTNRNPLGEEDRAIQYDIGGMSVVFAPIDPQWVDDAPRLFNEAGDHPTNPDYNELSSLRWVTETQFLEMTNGDTVSLAHKETTFSEIRSVSRMRETVFQENSPVLPLGKTGFSKPFEFSNLDSKTDYIMWPRLQKFYSAIYTKELHDLLYIRYFWFDPTLKGNILAADKFIDSFITKKDTRTSDDRYCLDVNPASFSVVSNHNEKLTITTTIQCSAN